MYWKRVNVDVSDQWHWSKTVMLESELPLMVVLCDWSPNALRWKLMFYNEQLPSVCMCVCVCVWRPHMHQLDWTNCDGEVLTFSFLFCQIKTNKILKMYPNPRRNKNTSGSLSWAGEVDQQLMICAAASFRKRPLILQLRTNTGYVLQKRANKGSLTPRGNAVHAADEGQQRLLTSENSVYKHAISSW